jgi:hypothetical protein
MNRRASMAVLTLFALVSACAETTTATNSDASSQDAGDAVTDGPAGDVILCPPRMPLPPIPSACAGLVELTAATNIATSELSGVTSFALPAVSTEGGRVRPSCAVEPGRAGVEAAARFTPPTGGHWRITASGERFGGLRVVRGCVAQGACETFAGDRGANVAGVAAVEVMAQRGESFSVVVDGCPEGSSCTYRLRADRIGALACPGFVGGVPRPCATTEVCAVDRCDSERFVCAPEGVARIASARVFVDRASNRGRITGRFRAVAPPALRPYAWAFMTDWMRADGTRTRGGYLSDGVYEGDAFTFESVSIPAEATRVHLWLYGGSRPVETQSAEGVDVDLDAWPLRAAGDPCDDAMPLQRCAAGLRCRTEGAGSTGVCAAVDGLEITALRAWRDPLRNTLTLRIEGLSLGATVTQVRGVLLGADGGMLARLSPTSVVTVEQPPTGVRFTAYASITRGPELAELFRTTRVRVSVVDTMSRSSANFEANLEEVAALPSGASCVDASAGCAAGLSCDTSLVGGSRCAPPPPRRSCDIGAYASTWAPVGPGLYTFESTFSSVGGATACASGKGFAEAQLEFVAPTRGRYVFETRGATVIEVQRGCGVAPMPTCRQATDPSVEVEFEAGERAAITVLNRGSRTPFTVTARVP